MRVNVVSDVHGRIDALRDAADGADALLCLGDLLLFIDYADHGQGIFPDLFGAEAASELITLRTAKRFDEARGMSGRRGRGGAWCRAPPQRGGRGGGGCPRAGGRPGGGTPPSTSPPPPPASTRP